MMQRRDDQKKVIARVEMLGDRTGCLTRGLGWDGRRLSSALLGVFGNAGYGRKMAFGERWPS